MADRSTILIVDDEELNIDFIFNELKNDYNLKVASDGEVALQVLSKFDIDLILLDIQMPKLNGYEVAEAIMKDPRLKDIPFLFLTAQSDSRSLVHGFELGAKDYLTKPFNPKELHIRVKNHLTAHLQKKRIQEHQKEIETLNSRLEEAQHIAKVGSWSFDIVNKELEWSSELYNIFEIDKKFNPSYKSCLNLIHPDDRITVDKAYKESLKNNRPYEVTHRILMDDKRVKWLHQRYKTVFDKNNKPLQSIGTVQDITELKEKDLMLQEQTKMAALGEMLANIAHQWRQPLSVISSAASGLELKYDMDDLDKEDLYALTETIYNQTKYLSNTIDTFRKFIKNEKETKDIVLQEEIIQAKSIISSVLKNEHIKLMDNIDYEHPLTVHMTTGELPQVLINIINNAKDIILEKNIQNGRIKLDLQKQEDKITVTVEDNGGGIPQEVLPHIFEPYFTTKHKSRGTGLGLHMSYKIITESLNGKIYAKNTQQGAKFFIELALGNNI